MDKIIHAAQYGDFHFIEKSIEENNVFVDASDDEKCSLLHWASINGRYDIVHYLVGKNANVNLIGGANGEIPLQWAVRHPKNAQVVKLLIEERSNVHWKSIYGYDALFIAVQEGRTNAAFVLLNSGASVDTVDNTGDTPLYWLLKQTTTTDRTNLVRLLLRFNASTVAVAKAPYNALHLLLGSAADPNDVDLDLALLLYSAAHARGDLDVLLVGRDSAGLTPRELAVRRRSSSFVRFLFDAYLYCTLPAATPIVSTAAAFCAVFAVVHCLGWLWGSPLLAGLYFLWQGCSQTTLTAAQSRLSCGGAWGVIATIVGSFYLFLARDLSAGWNLAVTLLAALICVSLQRTMVTAPASISHRGLDPEWRAQLVDRMARSEEATSGSGGAAGDDAEPTATAAAAAAGEIRLCTTCLVDKAQASMHCSKCNLCVVDLDHHCPYVCNCVGRGNRRWFLLFTGSAAAGCGLFAVLSLWLQYREYCADSADGLVFGLLAVQQCMLQTRATVAVVTWLSAVVALWILCIFSGQLGLIAGETTTYQVIKHRNYGVDMWTARGLRNVLHFVATGNYSVAPKRAKKEPPKCTSRNCGHGHDHGRSVGGDLEEGRGLLLQEELEQQQQQHGDQFLDRDSRVL